MPDVSQKQHNFMEAVDHDPAFAKKVGVAQSVGRDFVEADKAAGKFAHANPREKRAWPASTKARRA